jgi:hypothetical protein
MTDNLPVPVRDHQEVIVYREINRAEHHPPMTARLRSNWRTVEKKAQETPDPFTWKDAALVIWMVIVLSVASISTHLCPDCREPVHFHVTWEVK